jgi:hypothetical protein
MLTTCQARVFQREIYNRDNVKRSVPGFCLLQLSFSLTSTGWRQASASASGSLAATLSAPLASLNQT